MGLLAFALCLSSFQVNAQSESETILLKKVITDNFLIINKIYNKSKLLTETERVQYFQDCMSLANSISTDESKANNSEVQKIFAEKLGFSDFNEMTSLFNQLGQSKKEYLEYLNVNNLDQSAWEEAIRKVMDKCGCKDIMEFKDNDGGGDASYSNCRDGAGYLACSTLAMSVAQGCLWGCASASICPPCGVACAAACLIGQTAAIYLCKKTWCD